MQEATRTAYQTSLKYLAKHDLLPAQYRQMIHRSLIYKWKQEPEVRHLRHPVQSIVFHIGLVNKAIQYRGGFILTRLVNSVCWYIPIRWGAAKSTQNFTVRNDFSLFA